MRDFDQTVEGALEDILHEDGFEVVDFLAKDAHAQCAAALAEPNRPAETASRDGGG